MPSPKKQLTLLIAAPRGFCAGVDRAIQIVELALERYGAPVYVRHEIVHNKFVVDSLRAKGAVFVGELDQVPDGVPVVFSAHGVPKAVPARAQERGLNFLDATCPLVSKVHRQAERLVAQGRHILFIGHQGHPEVVGTFGQVPEGAMTLVETAVDAEAVLPVDGDGRAAPSLSLPDGRPRLPGRRAAPSRNGRRGASPAPCGGSGPRLRRRAGRGSRPRLRPSRGSADARW